MPNLRQKLTSAVTRRYPLFSGCGSFANSKLVRLMSGSESGSAWSQVPGGEVFADLDDFVGRSAYFSGELDRKITWVCKQLVQEGDTVLDIGANIGMVTVSLANLVGPNGQVHSFEPNPYLSGLLNKTKEHNSLGNVKVHPIGLGSTQDKLELVIPEGNRGAASLIRTTDGEHSETVSVDVDTLDAICSNENMTNVRLVKIDVEGFETAVFEGAHRFLTEVRPDAILFELNERSENQLREEPLLKLLDSYGYDFFVIPKNLVRMKLIKASDLSEDTNCGHDFLAAPKGSTFDEVARLVNANG